MVVSPRNITLRFSAAEMKEYGVQGNEVHLHVGKLIPENLVNHPYVKQVIEAAGRPRFDTHARVPNPRDPNAQAPAKVEAPDGDPDKKDETPALTAEEIAAMSYPDLLTHHETVLGTKAPNNIKKAELIALLSPPAA